MIILLNEVLAKNHGELRTQDYLDLLDIMAYRRWLLRIPDRMFVDEDLKYYRDLMENIEYDEE